MKKHDSSITSLVSAYGRAYHSKHDTPKIFDDFIALHLLTEEEFTNISKNMIQGMNFFDKDSVIKFQDNSEEILKWITQVHLSPTPLARGAYCEQVLQHDITLGLKQYVILGSGLDSFCFRHPEYNDCIDIFEVDHPATQADKKQRLMQANLDIPNNLHFIPMDFTKEFSFRALLDAGFKYEKTFFSLLGVSYYLSKEEISDLLMNLFSRVPSGSSIVFDYADETLFEKKGLHNRVSNMVKMASASHEPMKSCFTYEEIERLLEKSNLLIYEHLSPDHLNARFFNNRADYLTAFETIHYIHAVKK
ncbi:class I SAM-dependent methyltransferase [Ornithinibacillus xuwenensis]|uniref:S-adenosyl-L-methionine-dependent methyltransferase n=1 Tax=Ornithinibacillus xuwenensis TaxID=3144668 RepID=A0ABU9XEP8_9BACI